MHPWKLKLSRLFVAMAAVACALPAWAATTYNFTVAAGTSVTVDGVVYTGGAAVTLTDAQVRGNIRNILPADGAATAEFNSILNGTVVTTSSAGDGNTAYIRPKNFNGSFAQLQAQYPGPYNDSPIVSTNDPAVAGWNGSAWVSLGGSGSGSFTAAGDLSGTSSSQTIVAGAVTPAKQASFNANSILCNNTGVVATAIYCTASQIKSLLAIANTDVTGLGSLATQSGTFSGTSSGTNTGDQTITLTGDVTGSGNGSFATTIGAGAVSLAKQANHAANSIQCNNTGSPATAIDCTAAQAKTLLAIANTDVSGLGTFATANAATPPAIGGTTPAAGAFSSLSATGLITPSATVGIKGTGGANTAQAASVGEIMSLNCPMGNTATVTISTASPTVVTWTSAPFTIVGPTNWTCALNFTGTLPTGLSASTTYYLAGASYNAGAGTFNIASTLALALANTPDINATVAGTPPYTGIVGAFSNGSTGAVAVGGMIITAGDFDCTGNIEFNVTTTATTTVYYEGEVANATTFGSDPAKFTLIHVPSGSIASGTTTSIPAPVFNGNLSGNQTIEMLAQWNSGAGVINMSGFERCRRMR